MKLKAGGIPIWINEPKKVSFWKKTLSLKNVWKKNINDPKKFGENPGYKENGGKDTWYQKKRSEIFKSTCQKMGTKLQKKMEKIPKNFFNILKKKAKIPPKKW